MAFIRGVISYLLGREALVVPTFPPKEELIISAPPFVPPKVVRGLERREEAMCYTASASLAQYENCMNGADQWFAGQGECSSLGADQVVEAACSCVWIMSLYECHTVECPNFATADLSSIYATLWTLNSACVDLYSALVEETAPPPVPTAPSSNGPSPPKSTPAQTIPKPSPPAKSPTLLSPAGPAPTLIPDQTIDIAPGGLGRPTSIPISATTSRPTTTVLPGGAAPRGDSMAVLCAAGAAGLVAAAALAL